MQLNAELKENGLLSLQNKLKALDEVSFNNIAIDNPHRVIRALEICIGTGQPYSSFLNKEKAKRNFKVITIGLTAEREIIYSRINKRVDLMLESGLLKEVESLKELKHLNALNTVGYKELYNYFDGLWDLDFAVSEIKKNSRRFAKRQMTWFKKDDSIKWFNQDYKLHTITDYINEKIQQDY
jgi:tRNA dimethylallyltransferase